MASYPWFTDYGLLYGGIYGIPIDRNGNLQSSFEDDHQAWYVVPCHHRSIYHLRCSRLRRRDGMCDASFLDEVCVKLSWRTRKYKQKHLYSLSHA